MNPKFELKGGNMDRNLSSGIYVFNKCRKNEVVHSRGEPFAPCGLCGSNNSWKLVRNQKNV